MRAIILAAALCALASAASAQDATALSDADLGALVRDCAAHVTIAPAPPITAKTKSLPIPRLGARRDDFDPAFPQCRAAQRELIRRQDAAGALARRRAEHHRKDFPASQLTRRQP